MVRFDDLKLYDGIKLKDGRAGAVVELLGPDMIMVDVGSSPKDWETIDVTIEDVEEITHPMP